VEHTQQSDAFDLLDRRLQRWIWDQGWTELRDAQELAIKPILSGSRDVIISAATAGGKTEAAFLPICSKLLASSAEGLKTLYVSPLKALINDQFDRLEAICERAAIPVHRWHGDVGSALKKRVLLDPEGILLITPESIEALFVNHGNRIEGLFSDLSYVVIDELHAFLGTERGKQLQSLLHRIELVLRRPIPRIGLSATLGDMSLAAEYLRPGKGNDVELITSSEEGQEVKLQLRGYRITAPRLTNEEALALEEHGGEIGIEDVTTGDALDISADLYSTLRGTDNLIYANTRRDVELYADLLRRLSERQHLPNEFWPHHGNLSKQIREDVETMLKTRSRPVNVVCTTTLELGIDIGDVESIAQIGAPPSVSSMRQRLGRSGRRGNPAVMRLYVREPEIVDQTPPQDTLRPHLVQAIAMVELLIQRWYEPPRAGALHLSTLVQQVLSLIAQYGGVRAADAWQALCQGGPFRAIDRPTFALLLRGLGEGDLIQQSSDDTLLLGLIGERIVNHYSFYAAFMTPEEYRLVSEGRTLGTLPIEHPLSEGVFIIFGGRRWRVLSVDQERKVVELVPSAGGRPPTFGGAGTMVHERVRREMLRTYREVTVPPYLDAKARDLLEEARHYFVSYQLHDQSILQFGEDVLLFLWVGDRVLNTVAVELRAKGLAVTQDGVALTIAGITSAELTSLLKDLANRGQADGVRLAATIENKWTEKYDRFLWEELLCSQYASKHLDPVGAHEVLTRLVD
jgi:ATP-dependent helicase Lhr and Lhr-like helicase